MNPSWKRGLTILMLIVILVAVGLLATAWSMFPLDRTSVTIDGESFSLADLGAAHSIVVFVVALAAVVFAVLVALAAGAFGLGVGALGLAFGLAVTVGVLALVASPFLLFAWLMWRLVRARPTTPMVVRA